MKIQRHIRRTVKSRVLFRSFVGTCAFLAVACSPQLPTPPKPASTLEARREQDLDYLVEIIDTVHPDPFLRCSEAEFRTEVEEIRREIPELDDASFQLALHRLMSSLEDAHSSLSGFLTPEYPHALPFKPEYFDEGFIAVGCQPDHPDLLGARIIAINGRPYEDLVERCAVVIPAANPHWVRSNAPDFLLRPRFLHTLGLAEHEDRFQVDLEMPGGDRVTREFTTATFDADSWHHVLSNVEDLHATMHPGTHESGAPYWWEFRPDEGMLYFQYNHCRSHEDHPFETVTKEILERIDRGDVKTVVVDLRYNGGGSNSVAPSLTNGLATRARRGRLEHLYVLTGPVTFSAAVDFAVRLRGNAGAIVVGTPTGGMPNCFGNAVDFTLPNSGIEGWCSTGYFRLVGGEPPTLEPDVDVGRPWGDYSIGRDTAMEWVLSQDEGTHEK